MNKFRNFCLMILLVAGFFLFVGGGCDGDDGGCTKKMCPDGVKECRSKTDCSNCECDPGEVLVTCEDGKLSCGPSDNPYSRCSRCWYPDGPFVKEGVGCPCSPEHPCPKGQICDPILHICVEPCDADSDCGREQFCCKSNNGDTCCPRGNVCDPDRGCLPCPTSSCNGYCEEGVPHCADGSVPADGTCAGCPALCPNGTNEECEVYGPQYTNCCNKVCCKAACNTDGTCPCATPVDCGGQICCSGKCCPGGQVCKNNTCVDADTPCDRDSECSGGVCCKDSSAAPKAGFCKAQCNCSASSDCLSGVCCSNKCCPSGNICINGQCVPCENVKEKCDLEVCLNQHICKCKNGSNAPGNDPAKCPCSVANDCPGNRDCCNGVCCAEGQKCNSYTAQCEQICDPNNPNCPSGKQCCNATNTCSQVCSCQSNADCPNGYACCGNKCCASGVCNSTNTGCGICPQKCKKCAGNVRYCADGSKSNTLDCSDCNDCQTRCTNDPSVCCDTGYCDENERCVQPCPTKCTAGCHDGKCYCSDTTTSKTGACCSRGGEAPLGNPNACCNGYTPYKPATGWASSVEEVLRQGCCKNSAGVYAYPKDTSGKCEASGCGTDDNYNHQNGECHRSDSF